MIEVRIEEHEGREREVTLLHGEQEVSYSGALTLRMEHNGPHRLFLGSSEVQPPFRVYLDGALIMARYE